MYTITGTPLRRLVRTTSLGALLSLLLLLWGSPALAQNPPPRRGMNLDAIMAALTEDEELALTEEQATELRTILEEQNEAMRRLMQEAREGGNRAGTRAKMTELREANHERIAELLGEDQLARFQELRERMRRRGPPRQRRPGARFGPSSCCCCCPMSG